MPNEACSPVMGHSGSSVGVAIIVLVKGNKTAAKTSWKWVFDLSLENTHLKVFPTKGRK